MNFDSKLFFKTTATYGLALGVIVVIYNLLLYFFNIMPVGITKPLILSVIIIAIYFMGILIFSKRTRNEVFEGEFNFIQAWRTGIVIGFFAAIITSAYNYLLNVIIDPEYMARYIGAQAQYMSQYMYEKGVPDDQIEALIESLDEAGKTTITFGTYIKTLLLNTLGFSVISLITAAILKNRKNNPFAE